MIVLICGVWSETDKKDGWSCDLRSLVRFVMPEELLVNNEYPQFIDEGNWIVRMKRGTFASLNFCAMLDSQ